MALCCPITGRQKGYPFEVPLPPNPDVYGVVLVDHLKSIDWRARGFDYIAKTSDDIMEQVLDKLNTLLT